MALSDGISVLKDLVMVLLARVEALESEDSLLKDFQNQAVHDCWESYFGFEQCQHALCGATCYAN